MIQGRSGRVAGAARRHLVVVAATVESPDHVQLISDILTKAISLSRWELLALKSYLTFRERYLL